MYAKCPKNQRYNSWMRIKIEYVGERTYQLRQLDFFFCFIFTRGAALDGLQYSYGSVSLTSLATVMSFLKACIKHIKQDSVWKITTEF